VNNGPTCSFRTGKYALTADNINIHIDLCRDQRAILIFIFAVVLAVDFYDRHFLFTSNFSTFRLPKYICIFCRVDCCFDFAEAFLCDCIFVTVLWSLFSRYIYSKIISNLIPSRRNELLTHWRVRFWIWRVDQIKLTTIRTLRHFVDDIEEYQ